MTVWDIVSYVERLNLAHHHSLIGAYFPEIIALLSIVFGGSFLLFGWKHHEYFLGMTGLLAGGWVGLLLRSQIAPAGTLAPFMYLVTCAAAGAFIGACCPRFVGILLGGFTVMLLSSVFMPLWSGGNDPSFLNLCIIFLLGGGLGGLFPKLFFILNSSLIGSAFVTYGLSLSLLAQMGPITPPVRVLLHLIVFLPLFIFGLVYQGLSGREEPLRVVEREVVRPAPRPARAGQPAAE